MECALCQIRSSMGFCVECGVLLCDVCGIGCDRCRKMVCGNHIHLTKGGRRLCKVCYDERKSRQTEAHRHATEPEPEQEAPATSFAALQNAPEPPAPHEHHTHRHRPATDIADEALVQSGWAAPPVWQLCVYTAGVGFFAMGIVWALPNLPRVPIPPLGLFHPALVLMIIPLLAMLWGAWGLWREKYYHDRFRCVAGIAVAVITIGLGLHILFAAPDKDDRGDGVMRMERDGLNPADLAKWREQQKKKYGP